MIPSDVVFVLDESSSVTRVEQGGGPLNYERIKTFMLGLIGRFQEPDPTLSSSSARERPRAS